MTHRKIRQSLLPTLLGVLVAFFLFYFYNELMAIINFPADGDQFFSANAFYIPLFLMSFIPIFLIAGIFQFFIAIPVWEYYKKGKKLFKLKLWQLIVFSSLIFGISVSLLSMHKYMAKNQVIINIACATLITVSYWFTNSATLKSLEREKNIS
jgi:hypothetical protein